VVSLITGGEPAIFGFSTSVNPFLAFLCGFGIYFVVLGLIEVGAHFSGVKEELHDQSYETMRRLWPRQIGEKIKAVIAVCLLNPFTEELIYRGVLVYFLGVFIGNFWLAAAIGLAFSLAVHLYQGAWSIPFHFLFHGTAILLVLSPLGLVACFGFHFAGDLVPVAALKKNMYAWRDRQRLRRRHV